jgi:hypothetical protein
MKLSEVLRDQITISIVPGSASDPVPRFTAGVVPVASVLR